jgi:hypothetical protein
VYFVLSGTFVNSNGARIFAASFLHRMNHHQWMGGENDLGRPKREGTTRPRPLVAWWVPLLARIASLPPFFGVSIPNKIYPLIFTYLKRQGDDRSPVLFCKSTDHAALWLQPRGNRHRHIHHLSLGVVRSVLITINNIIIPCEIDIIPPPPPMQFV